MSGIENVIRAMSENSIPFEERVMLSTMTSFGIGGPADLLVRARNEVELAKCLRIISQEGIPIFVIGRGTNILASDEGFKGAILKIENIEISEVGRGRFRFGAGIALDAVVEYTANKGFADAMEFAGIPGSFGGAIAMNAGAWEKSTSNVLDNIEAFDLNGNPIDVDIRDIFDYRTFKRRGESVIFSGTIKLEIEDDPKNIRDRRKQILSKRTKTQPLTDRSAGCVFKNPQGDHAGRLIDIAGLKGFSVGDASVSEIHANFIVNKGEATASDVLKLIEKIREIILEKFGIELELEIIKLGFME